MIATELYSWLLFVHVLAAAVWVGGACVLAVLVFGTIRAADPDEVARFAVTLRRIGPVLLAPATVLTVAFGVWLVLESAAWDFGQLWVQIGVTLFVAAFLIGAIHQSRTAIKAERAAAGSNPREALRQLSRWAVGYAVIIALLVAAVWDMTAKPGF